MIEEIRLPEISENVESGDVIGILVKIGDLVEKEQPVVELETEKAAFEVPSPVRGKVVEIKIKEGDKVKIGQVLLKINTDAEASQGEAPENKPEAEEEQQLSAKEGQEKKEEIIQEIEQKKAVGEPEKEGHETESQTSIAAIQAAPSVRQLARELGIDISKVKGTSPSGSISAEDIKKYAKNVISGEFSGVSVRERRALPDFTKWGEIERRQISTTRRKISEILCYAWANIPHVTQYDKADITALEQFRKEYSGKVEEAGGKLTISSILLKIVGSALKEFPVFNSSFDMDSDEIIYKKYFHIAVAVATDRGLLVPVIRDVNKKNILQLSVELTELAKKTRQHKVAPDDMVGGNFTISNLGGIGGTNFSPIIYWPQVAILGVAKAVQNPIYINGKFEPRLILPLSLSYDHRVIDGTEGLNFMRWVAESLEKPYLLALNEKVLP